MGDSETAESREKSLSFYETITADFYCVSEEREVEVSAHAV